MLLQCSLRRLPYHSIEDGKGPEEADGTGENVGGDASPEDAGKAKEGIAKVGEGNDQADDSNDVERGRLEGLANAVEKEAVVAMDFHHAVADGDDFKVVGQDFNDGFIFAEEVGEGTRAEPKDDSDEEAKTESEDRAVELALFHSIETLRPVVLADKGNEGDAEGHRDHEGKHLDATGGPDGGNSGFSMPGHNEGDDGTGDRHQDVAQPTGQADVEDFLPRTPHLAPDGTLKSDQLVALVQNPDHEKAPERTRNQGRKRSSADAKGGKAGEAKDHDGIEDDVDQRTGHHDQTRTDRISCRADDIGRHHGKHHKGDAEIPDRHVLADQRHHFRFGPQHSENWIDRQEPPGRDHDHDQQSENQRVGGYSLGRHLIVAPERVRDRRRSSHPQTPRQADQQHDDGKRESHRRQRTGPELRHKPGVGQVEGVHREGPAQHRNPHPEEGGQNRALREHRARFS